MYIIAFCRVFKGTSLHQHSWLQTMPVLSYTPNIPRRSMEHRLDMITISLFCYVSLYQSAPIFLMQMEDIPDFFVWVEMGCMSPQSRQSFPHSSHCLGWKNKFIQKSWNLFTWEISNCEKVTNVSKLDSCFNGFDAIVDTMYLCCDKIHDLHLGADWQSEIP